MRVVEANGEDIDERKLELRMGERVGGWLVRVGWGGTRRDSRERRRK